MLDPKGRADVMAMIKKIHESGITVLHITHNMKEALLADRVVIVNDGTLFAEGTPREVFSRVDALKSIGLEAPQVTELCHALTGLGITLPTDTVSEDEAFREIMALYTKER